MLELGQTAIHSRTITDQDVKQFAKLTGDFNPIHVNDESAKRSIFKSRIAHGMLTGSFISAVIGTKLPGPGTIYLEQCLKFKKPVYLGETVTTKVEIVEIINEEKEIYRLDTKVLNSNNEIVIEGSAVVKHSLEF